MTGKTQHLRKMTWLILAWSAAILVWTVVSAAPIASASCTGDVFDHASAAMDSYMSTGSTGSTTCLTIDVNGGKAGAIFAVVLGHGLVWLLGFIPLAIVWFMTRRNTVGPADVPTVPAR